MGKILWNLREGRELDAALWTAFRERAIKSGHSPTAALARIIRRYLAHGYDDGQPEQGTDTRAGTGAGD